MRPLVSWLEVPKISRADVYMHPPRPKSEGEWNLLVGSTSGESLKLHPLAVFLNQNQIP